MRATLWIGLVLCVALAVPSQAGARPLETALWTINLSSLGTRAETGALNGFDEADVQATSSGAALRLMGDAAEDWFFGDPRGFPPRSDGPEAYSLSAASLTDVTISCKTGDAAFAGSAEGRGGLRVNFDDGTRWWGIRNGPSIPFDSVGTGFAKASVGFKAEGDLPYDPTEDPLGLAEGVGDAPGELGGEAPLPGGGSISFTPNSPGNPVTKSLSAVGAIGSGQKVMKRTFEYRLRAQMSLDMSVDDQMIGAAFPEARVDVRQDSKVIGESCRDPERNWVSSLELNVVTETGAPRPGLLPLRASATANIVTIDLDDGAVVERVEGISFRPDPEHVFRRTNQRLLTDTPAWGPPSRDWSFGRRYWDSKPPAASGGPASQDPAPPVARGSRRLGVRRGSAATYAFAARHARLKRVRRLSFKVVEADRRTGRLVVNGTVRLSNGRTRRARLPVEAFEGEGDLRAILIPTGLRAGQRVYGIGRVVRVRGDEVTVRYREGAARATATYDRGTGWLIEMTGGNPRRPGYSLRRVGGGPVVEAAQ